MIDINARQKDPSNLEFWKAYNVKYSIAKRYRIPRIIFTYFLVLVVPFIILNNSQSKNVFAIIGAIWTIVAVIVSYIEKDIIKDAAKIQDEFDTRIFDMDWNKILLGDHISEEVVHSLSCKFNGSVDEKWYGDLNSIPYPYSIILCQRSNVVWDWRLRKIYFLISLITLIMIAIGGIVLSIFYQLSLEAYFTTVFFPSSSAYILGFKELKEHHDNYTAKQTLEKRINSVIDIAIAQKASVDIIVLRQIQDVIYSLRKCTAIIPDWFYRLFRKKYDKRMQAILNKYSTRLAVL